MKAKGSKAIWNVAKIPSFKKDFLKLTPKEQWIVGRAINSMRYVKNPARLFPYPQCDHCPENMYLFGVSDDGIGNKGLEIQMIVGKKTHTLYPFNCRKTTFVKNQ